METIINNIKINFQGALGDTINKVVFAIIVLVIGWIAIGWVLKILKKVLQHSKIDATLKPFIISLSSISLKVILIVSVINMAGEATSLVAVLGAASLAIGLAFQGALSNFAGGFLILTLRPFKVGDFVETLSHKGTVEAIHVFNTVLITIDNKVITIPNGQLSNASVINYTEKPTRRVDIAFGVGYDADIKLVAQVLESVISSHPLIHEDPAPFIKLAEHGDSALVFQTRSWCNTSDMWTVHYDLMTQVKLAFDENNISIPFPQMDVHFDKTQG
ncbi:Small-conductance mechanosensitive channel [Petrocella atlantisensis]|uniref:Small-conductance mechanosensitive channel n=1 Tax=Petrocella atlantisensis TaxID=2173034 RepID=A0A3P7P5W7_9FIRM|nr:mechanosensitive ion channel domain-containing protein [Petrocella atlantisensis]MCF8018679.1 mechanosensitive ion channel [Vallitaleaceae bacterium]VDN48940.1 Small-conductance mechanosensitive channel [Petrocella atlantisensis]